MKEEIERRRAEAAEKKRQKEESGEDGKAPFKCLSPKGASAMVSFPKVKNKKLKHMCYVLS